MRLVPCLAVLALSSLVLQTACDGGVANTGGAGGQGAGGEGAGGEGAQATAAGGQSDGGSGLGGSNAGGQGGDSVCDSSWDKIEECFEVVGEPPPCDSEWQCISECILPLTCDELMSEGNECASYCTSACPPAIEHLAECGIDSPGVECQSCAGTCEAECIVAASCADLASGGGAYAECKQACLTGSQTPCAQLADKFFDCGLAAPDDECEMADCTGDALCFSTCLLPASCEDLESGDAYRPCADQCGFGEGGAGGSSSTVTTGVGAGGTGGAG